MNKIILLATMLLLSIWGSHVSAEGIDKTALIKNAGFESANKTQLKSTSNGGIWQPEDWTVDYKGDAGDVWDQAIVSSGKNGTGGALSPEANAPEGNQFYYFRTRWITSSLFLNQTLKEVPRGAYTLSCTAIAPDGAAYPTTLSVKTIIKTESVDMNAGEWTEYSIDFSVLGEKEDVTIGAMLDHIDAGDQGRIFIDNFRLTYNGEPDDGGEIDKLKEKIADLLSVADGFIELDLPQKIWKELQEVKQDATDAYNNSNNALVLVQVAGDLEQAIQTAEDGAEVMLNLSNALEAGYINMDQYPDYPGYDAYQKALTAAILTINDEKAGISEFEEAIEKLEKSTRTFFLSGFANASIDNPAEATWLITNPDFELEKAGWDATDWGMQTNNNYEGFEGRFMERWVNDAGALGNSTFSQTINEIPNGLYVISAYMIATRQNAPEQEVTGTYLYGNAATTAASTENGIPQLFTTEVIVTDGTLTLGAKTVGTNANWVAIDNITLFYIGEDANSMKELILKEIETAEELMISENNGMIMGADKTAAKAAIEQGKSATSIAEMSAAYSALTAANSEMKASIVAYEAMLPALEETEELSLSTDYPEEDMTAFKNILSQQTNLLTAESTKGSDLAAIAETLFKAIRILKLSALKEATLTNPVDATWLIVNPDFEGNTINGWTCPEGVTAVNHSEIEFFNKTFNFYQEIKEIPNGVYDLSMQGFQRTAANDSAKAYEAGTEIITAYLYANSDSAQLRSLYSEPRTSLEDVSGLLNGYPNGMQGAQEAFTQGLYKGESLTVTVDKKTLTIGVRNRTLTANGWVCFDNFVLTYRGNEAGVNITEVNRNSSSLQAYSENGYIKVVNAEKFTITTLSGITVSTDNQLAPGIYIINANGETTKVMIP